LRLRGEGGRPGQRGDKKKTQSVFHDFDS
jgi:hypothetical protein